MRVTANDALEIDITTRVVRADENIYVIQPGEGYHLYDHFSRSNVVFLDFPDLAIDFEIKPEWRRLREHVVRSLEIQEWVNDEKRAQEPSRDIKDYIGEDHGRRLGRYAGAVEALYYDLPAGTIVVVPGPYIDDPVLIGELQGKPSRRSWKSLYSGEPMAIRRVRWLRKRSKAAMSPELRSKFGTPNPIMQLDRSLREEIVRVGYDQYVFEDEYAARLTTSTADFSTLDDFNIQSFVNYAAGVLVAYDVGVRDRELTFDEALAYLEDNRELIPDLAQSINSPGFQRLYDSTITPLVIGVLLTMATSESAAGAQPVMPKIVNSSAPSEDSCAITVSKRAEEAMKLMKLDEWKRVCERAQRAKEHTGISTSMKAQKSKAKKRSVKR